MQLKADPRQPVQQTVGSMEPSRPWIFALPPIDSWPLAMPGLRPYSFFAECECPYDCPRDHENE